MKTSILAIGLAAAFTLTAWGADRTLVTRNGKTYQQAEITKQDVDTVTIKHAGGVATVLMEDLPADWQKELGYKTHAERKTEITNNTETKTTRDTTEAAAKSSADQEKKATLAIEQGLTASKTRPNFYGKTEAEIEALYGKPKEIRTGENPQGGKYRTWVYDDAKGKNTTFDIRDGEKTVSGGFYKGVPIQKPESR
jgi:hypothetical protein